MRLHSTWTSRWPPSTSLPTCKQLLWIDTQWLDDELSTAVRCELSALACMCVHWIVTQLGQLREWRNSVSLRYESEWHEQPHCQHDAASRRARHPVRLRQRWQSNLAEYLTRFQVHSKHRRRSRAGSGGYMYFLVLALSCCGSLRSSFCACQ